MSNYTLNNIRRLITHIEEYDYWDMHLNEAYYGGLPYGEECLISSIDTTNPECVKGDELLSLNDYFYGDGCYNGILLENIGYTGVDNGLIKYRKDRISNEDFYKIYTDSEYSIESGDTRLHLHAVSGNNSIYDYPTSINEDGSIKLNGGFYQGFFRSGNDYAVLPSEIGVGEEWNISFKLRKVDYEPESTKTLNDKHPENKGIFFYIGTRAENKWIYLYDKLEMSGTTFGDCPTEGEDDYVFDLLEDEMVLSSQTFDTKSGFDISSSNDDYILSDNKFLIFDRTPGGITISNYEDDDTVMIQYKKHVKSDLNLFLYMNRTPSGYTVNDIDSIEEEQYKYTDDIFYSDIKNNAFALFIDDNGAIGYKYLVKSCDEVDENGYKIISGKSYDNIIEYDEWYDIRISFKGFSDGMKLMFYINGKLKYITSKLPKLNLKMLNELKEKQEGVAYNISIGGGTQGLAETIMPEYTMIPVQSFPLEENFAGSFIGDIKGFNFYIC